MDSTAIFPVRCELPSIAVPFPCNILTNYLTVDITLRVNGTLSNMDIEHTNRLPGLLIYATIGGHTIYREYKE